MGLYRPVQAARRIAALAKKPDNRDLCHELAVIEAEGRAVFARRTEVKKLLTGGATENYQETFDNIGVVKVSAPKDGRCKGTAPELDIAAFLALPEPQQERLIQKGVVKIVPQMTGKYYGSVTVELF